MSSRLTRSSRSLTPLSFDTSSTLKVESSSLFDLNSIQSTSSNSQSTLIPPTQLTSTSTSTSTSDLLSASTHFNPTTLKQESSNRQSKLNQFKKFKISPFPDFTHPTPIESRQVFDLLSSSHGIALRPETLVDKQGARAGCGEVSCALDALIRTILSQNTTSKNSTYAKNALDAEYGRANWGAVLSKPLSKLIETIKSGGLAERKGKCIMGILKTLDERGEGGKGGELNLDYLKDLNDDDAMEELISFPGVGLKTASCVLLFCLGRDSFAVDTHVHRLSLSLGWIPPSATRDQAYAHLNSLIPNELKYGLHTLLVKHGRGCKKCSANGVVSMDFVDFCSIDGIVRRGAGGKKGIGKGKGKGKKVKVEMEIEEEGEEKPLVDLEGGSSSSSQYNSTRSKEIIGPFTPIKSSTSSSDLSSPLSSLNRDSITSPSIKLNFNSDSKIDNRNINIDTPFTTPIQSSNNPSGIKRSFDESSSSGSGKKIKLE